MDIGSCHGDHQGLHTRGLRGAAQPSDTFRSLRCDLSRRKKEVTPNVSGQEIAIPVIVRPISTGDQRVRRAAITFTCKPVGHRRDRVAKK